MKLLNLGCGGNRPQIEPWINIDNLHAIFPDPVNQVERQQLDAEKNYMNADLRNGLPFEDGEVDGILASHFLEHLDAQESLPFLKECKRVLKPGGVLRLSVPSPELFYKLSKEGCTDWGEKFPRPGIPEGLTFMEFALFFNEHKQLVSMDALNCFLWVTQFSSWEEKSANESLLPPLETIDNRQKFSLFVEAVK